MKRESLSSWWRDGIAVCAFILCIFQVGIVRAQDAFTLDDLLKLTKEHAPSFVDSDQKSVALLKSGDASDVLYLARIYSTVAVGLATAAQQGMDALRQMEADAKSVPVDSASAQEVLNDSCEKIYEAQNNLICEEMKVLEKSGASSKLAAIVTSNPKVAGNQPDGGVVSLAYLCLVDHAYLDSFKTPPSTLEDRMKQLDGMRERFRDLSLVLDKSIDGLNKEVAAQGIVKLPPSSFNISLSGTSTKDE